MKRWQCHVREYKKPSHFNEHEMFVLSVDHSHVIADDKIRKIVVSKKENY